MLSTVFFIPFFTHSSLSLPPIHYSLVAMAFFSFSPPFLQGACLYYLSFLKLFFFFFKMKQMPSSLPMLSVSLFFIPTPLLLEFFFELLIAGNGGVFLLSLSPIPVLAFVFGELNPFISLSFGLCRLVSSTPSLIWP